MTSRGGRRASGPASARSASRSPPPSGTTRIERSGVGAGSTAAGSGRCSTAPVEVEPRILLQDRSLERLERRGRVDAELLDQGAPRLLVGLERLGLPARPVQREHQLTAQPLAQRVLRDETLELAHELRVAAEREVGLDPLLERA